MVEEGVSGIDVDEMVEDVPCGEDVVIVVVVVVVDVVLGTSTLFSKQML